MGEGSWAEESDGVVARSNKELREVAMSQNHFISMPFLDLLTQTPFAQTLQDSDRFLV
jgi:hypothetical protein